MTQLVFFDARWDKEIELDSETINHLKENKVDVFIKNFFKSKLNLALLFGAIVLLGYLIISL